MTSQIDSQSVRSRIPIWVHQAVVYQIMPDRFWNGNRHNDPQRVRSWGERPTRSSFFGGDLSGIMSRLDYLQDLGVDTIYLTPIFQAPSTHKYDASDYFIIDPALGTAEEFQELLAGLHGRKMRLMLDGVFHHCGDRHQAFIDAVKHGPGSPTWDWFLFHGYPVRKRPKPNYEHGGIFYLPKWNLANPHVRRYLQKAIIYWTEQGIDGWRLDVPWYIEGHEFWQEFRELVRSINPEIYIVGEHWDDASPWLTGDQFDGATDYRLRKVMLDFASGGDGDNAAQSAGEHLKELVSAYLWEHRLAMWNLVGSHDTPRVATVLRGKTRQIQLAYVLAFTFPGVPQLYYGDEVGLRGGNDPDCRRCFPWDEETWNDELRRFVKDLISLRRQYPALQNGAWRLLHADGGLLAYQRGDGKQSVIIVVGNGKCGGSFTLPLITVKTGEPVIAWHKVLGVGDPSAESGSTWRAGETICNETNPAAWVFAASECVS